MQKARALALVSLFVACMSPAQSQGLMEGTFVRGLGAGMGAGTAASLSKGKTVRNTYAQMLQAQQAMLAQTKAIEQFVSTGAQMEAKKQWANAEQAFQSALQMIAKRDGPGSPKSAPVLEKLAKVSKEQKKLDQAIGYQKTVVAFANRAAQQNPAAAVQAQTSLSSMYIDKGDFANAEGVLKQSTDIVRRDKSINPSTYSSTLKVYGVVLRKLNKIAEAEQIDAELAQQGAEAATAAATHTEPDVSAAPAAVPNAAATAPANPSSSLTTPSAAPAATIDSASAAVDVKPEATSPQDVSASAPTAQTPTTSSSISTSPSVETSPSSPPPSAEGAVSSTNAAAPAALLPPPTADWPVMGADGKIGSEPSAPQSQSAEPSAATAPTTEEAKSAPSAEAADNSKTESK
jgi:hypothetical protein